MWKRAVKNAELPHVSLYEGTKHSLATDAIRRAVPERHLQQFLGHKNVESTRRYARLADNALLEVLPSRKDSSAKPVTNSSLPLVCPAPARLRKG